MDTSNERQRAISDSPALLLSAKADDIVDASSELDGIIVILYGFRWIDNERYLDMNTFERLLMLHTIEHMLSGHDYARALCSHFLTAASLTALVGPTRYLKLDGWDRRRALTICSQFPFVMLLSRLQCYLERRHPKAIFECSCTYSLGQDASSSQLPSQQCWYSFANEYTEANWAKWNCPGFNSEPCPVWGLIPWT